MLVGSGIGIVTNSYEKDELLLLPQGSERALGASFLAGTRQAAEPGNWQLASQMLNGIRSCLVLVLLNHTSD